MKTFALAAVAALITAAPAMAADFTGPRIEATAGIANATRNTTVKDVLYGVNAGYDLQLGKFVAGVETGVDNVLDRRNIAVGARVGFTPSDNVLVYAKAGYADWHQAAATARTRAVTLEGLRLGAGIEANLFGPFYTKVEYRHEDFGRVKTNGGFVGAGIRF